MVARNDLVSVLVSAAMDPVSGHNIMELHGPEPYRLDEIVEASCNVLAKRIAPLSLPKPQWQQIMIEQGLDQESASLWYDYYCALSDDVIQPNKKIIPLAGETVLSDCLYQTWKTLRQREREAIDPEKKIFKGLE